MKIKKLRNDSKELSLNEDESFDSRFDKEFEKYVDKSLSVKEFDALTKKMLEFENSSLTESTANSNGIYSLKNGWLKVPVKDDIPDDVDLEPELSEFRQRANECDSIESIDSFMDDIYKLRQESILTDGEYGKGNLVFKSLRNEGILQQLKDKKVELENKEMSLEEALEPVPKGTTTLFKDLMESLIEIAELEHKPDVAQRIKAELDSLNEDCKNDEVNENQSLSEAEAKLKDKGNKVLDWYHRAMEKQSLPGEYDREHPIIDEDLIARASNKFGFGSNKLRRALKGEDI